MCRWCFGPNFCVCRWNLKQCYKDFVLPITVCAVGSRLEWKMFMTDWTNQHGWQQSQPSLMNPQCETQSNYVWCYYGVCSLLVKNLPIISRSKSFQEIMTIVTCNFVVAQMIIKCNLATKWMALQDCATTGRCCLILITSDKHVSIYHFQFSCCWFFGNKKWHKHRCFIKSLYKQHPSIFHGVLKRDRRNILLTYHVFFLLSVKRLE